MGEVAEAATHAAALIAGAAQGGVVDVRKVHSESAGLTYGKACGETLQW